MGQHILTYTSHAEKRAMERGISPGQILKVVRSGERRPSGGRVLHYDLRAKVAAIVDWQNLVVVTVYRLSPRQEELLRNSLPWRGEAVKRKPCPRCYGFGYIDGQRTCPLCKGEGEIEG